MIAVGIDPGLRGALVAVDDRRQVRLMLSAKRWVRDGDYDVVEMARALAEVERLFLEDGGAWMVVLEKQGARPGEGVAGVFTNGMGFGIWRALLVDLEPLIVVPQRWQIVTRGAPGADPKRRARHVAGAVLGMELAAMEDGKADASCMALYGLHLLGAPL